MASSSAGKWPAGSLRPNASSTPSPSTSNTSASINAFHFRFLAKLGADDAAEKIHSSPFWDDVAVHGVCRVLRAFSARRRGSYSILVSVCRNVVLFVLHDRGHDRRSQMASE